MIARGELARIAGTIRLRCVGGSWDGEIVACDPARPSFDFVTRLPTPFADMGKASPDAIATRVETYTLRKWLCEDENKVVEIPFLAPRDWSYAKAVGHLLANYRGAAP